MMSDRPKLRVGVLYDDPLAFNCFRRMPRERCRRPGYEVQTFHDIMKLLKWDYEFVMVDKYDYGYIRNGTWTGLVGLLSSNQADITALTMRMTAQRQGAVDFSFPLDFHQQIFIIKRPAIHDFHNFLIKAFTPFVWFLLLGALLFVAVGFVKFAARLHHQLPKKIGQGFLQTLAILLKQPYTHPDRLSQAIYAINWVQACAILGVFYVCHMQSVLVVPLRTKMPFSGVEDLSDLIRDGKWKLVFHSPEVLPLCGTDPCSENLRKAVQFNPTELKRSTTALSTALMQGNRAFFALVDIDRIPNKVNRYSSRFVAIREHSVPLQGVAFAFQKNMSAYRRKFDQALIEISPFAKKYKSNYLNVYAPEYDANWKTSSVEISVCHLQEAFLLWVFSLLPAFLAFIVELAWSSYRGRGQMHF